MCGCEPPAASAGPLDPGEPVRRQDFTISPGPPMTFPPFAARGDAAAIEAGSTFQPRFDADGLIPAIVTDATTREVLMFAWMDQHALAATLTSGYATFFSRSRRRQWVKGEESGNRMRVVETRTDCDQDVLLVSVEVEGAGAACHTGARSCFYRRLEARDRTTVMLHGDNTSVTQK